MVVRLGMCLALLWGAAAPARSDDLEAALAAVRADEQHRANVFAAVSRTVVAIFGEREAGGGGSGVIIDPGGYGLTNFHVVQSFLKTRRGFGGLSDGRLYPLRVLGIDPGGDVVMFKLSGKERFDFAQLGDSDALRVGQWVAAMGNPFGLAEDFAPTITLGIISGLHRYQEGRGNFLEYADCIQVSTSINPGNSGGPLFDLEGRVVGINGRASFEQRGRVNVGLGYAVSVNQIKRFLPGLWAGRMVEHGTLGATVRRAGADLVVSAVQPFSAAEKAGVQLGDVLLEFAGRPVRTPNDFNNIVAIMPANWPVAVKLRRDGSIVELVVRLDRLALPRTPVYVVDIEHNHAELMKILAAAGSWDLIDAASRVTIAGTVHRIGESAGRPFAFEPLSPTGAAGAQSRPATNDRVPVEIEREWRAIAEPLLVRPEIGVGWEMLAGDEVAGRIVSVIERRFECGRRLRWKFDWHTRELLEAAFGDDEHPDAVVWRPGKATQFGDLAWPARWDRRTREGDETVIEIERISLAAGSGPGSIPARESGGSE